MILAVDVDYRKTAAHIAGVAFSAWNDATPESIHTSTLDGIEDYEPGAFFRRELPCILKLLRDHKLAPEWIVVDGFVHLDRNGEPGLGKYLYDVLGGRVRVIGVAKRARANTPESWAVYRGKSGRPLYVTAEGVSFKTAQEHIAGMSGQFRLPDLLRMADQACREWPGAKLE